MSPRKSVAETAATRSRIIDSALTLASTDGLEGLTIGRLATDLEMSKAGVIGHFGSKEALQLAVLAAAVERFRLRVPARAVGARPGTERLTRAFDEWIDYMTGEGHGGCFLTSVASEFDGRPGPVRDAVLDALASWSAYVAAELGTAVEAGELPPRTEVEQLAFELNGVALAANQSIQLHRDPQAPTRARRAVARLLSAP
ncbi:MULTISPECIES: TetR/AcrR family transcriptional regulator [unclassified Streptomyces]|uniref:TetR/AcrR family transcriptional regulator n=1 Tax=unclassified Streptomyces TaxID=2593676 RepID=UPI0011653EF7|nr:MULTISPECIES: TetR/AcrR family transcriptional regulator [unclassified Streptomyces]NMI56139.1 TetR/AcrR family transcriptional regulator [Streptomyces sp. RLA2-12]QDN55582.1 TetR/AcrR family transcriptional regulator [Streptomyces sp. S1D4-20]QDN65760.1 TetR/AcrR family transcriptional regulator [Streptomyces sp. S1D4-14]QDN96400.1 TetR/AcrR family transcriptional regulator [Streptomyces sp. RLB1-9]QDO18109.1 TetR/AcrR family transcriptional regulator [Streptomyces sp. S1A1-8]